MAGNDFSQGGNKKFLLGVLALCFFPLGRARTHEGNNTTLLLAYECVVCARAPALSGV